jgi:hypothetical protein
MMLDRMRNRLTLSSLLLAASLSGAACGEDAKTKNDEDDKSPSTRDDGGTNTRGDGGTPGRGDASSGSSDGGGTNRDASSNTGRDSGNSGEPTASTAGNTIYTGAPTCEGKTGRKVAGTIDGAQIVYDLADISKTMDDNFTASESGVDRGSIDISWEPAFEEDSHDPADLTEGELELPSKYDAKKYCVIEGKAQHGLDDDEGRIRDFYLITKVQEEVDGDCTGPELEAELKICATRL